MQLCFSTLACPNWPLPQIIGAAAAHGLKGIDFRGLGAEIDITRLPLFGAELPATLDLLHQHGLSVPCLNTSVALVTPATERWEMMLDECHRYAMLAGKLGSSYVRVFGGVVPREMTRGEALIMAHRHLRQLIKACGDSGCRVVLETHDDWAESEAALELLGDCSPDEVGVLWDLEHPYRRGEPPVQTATALGKYLRHIHIKDSVRRGGKNIPRLLGKGELPLGDLIGALRGVDYDAWICLETEKRWHPEGPEPEESLPQFVQFMAEHWTDHAQTSGAAS